MKTRIGIIFISAGAVAFAMLAGRGEALARPGGHHGFGGHMHHGGGYGGHVGHWHGGHRGHHPGWGGPHHLWRPHFHRPYGYGWRGPRRIFAPYPVYVRPRFGYGFAPGCTVRRSVGFAPGGWRKIVTVRTCYVR